MRVALLLFALGTALAGAGPLGATAAAQEEPDTSVRGLGRAIWSTIFCSSSLLG